VKDKMLDLNLIFRIAGLGILLLILDTVLNQSGKGEIAKLTNFVGIMIILSMVIYKIDELFKAVKTMFLL
jgi:stage III sporulation protein AC